MYTILILLLSDYKQNESKLGKKMCSNNLEAIIIMIYQKIHTYTFLQSYLVTLNVLINDLAQS